MADPPRDEDGIVQPHNDSDIRDDDGLLRYLNPAANHLAPDQNTGGWRISSALFSESSYPGGGMSVDLERPMVEETGSNMTGLPSPEFGIVRLITGDMRNKLGLKVGSDPKDDNPYHANVWGTKNKKKRSNILAMADMIKKPEGM